MPLRIKGISGMIRLKSKSNPSVLAGELVDTAAVEFTENHFLLNLSNSPLFFIFRSTLLNGVTNCEPLGKAIAEPDAFSIEGITLNCSSELALTNPKAIVSSTIAASILPALIS